MSFARVRDLNIYYEEYGTGFPLVMIMGLDGNTSWWDPMLVRGLSEHFRVIIFDNRGVGKTGGTEGEYSIKMFADDTVGLMDALGIEKAHVFGLSMGGMIAQEIALNYPERVEKLVLVVTHPGGAEAVPPKPEIMDLITLDWREHEPEEIIELWLKALFTPEFVEKYPIVAKISKEKLMENMIAYEDHLKQLKAIADFNAYERLKNLKIPTLVIGAERDILVPPENSVKIAKAIPNAKLAIVKDAGHGVIVEKREEVLKLVLDFLK